MRHVVFLVAMVVFFFEIRLSTFIGAVITCIACTVLDVHCTVLNVSACLQVWTVYTVYKLVVRLKVCFFLVKFVLCRLIVFFYFSTFARHVRFHK